MATQGPNLPTAATGNTGIIGGGNIVWGSPTNIELADGTSATNNLPNASISIQISDDLMGTGFGFSIPAGATINGILLQINARQSAVAGQVFENSIVLLKAGVFVGIDKSVGAALNTALTVMNYGGSSDLWGTTWTPADINGAGFGAAASYQNQNMTNARTASVDFFEITVTFTPAATAKSQMFLVI